MLFKKKYTFFTKTYNSYTVKIHVSLRFYPGGSLEVAVRTMENSVGSVLTNSIVKAKTGSLITKINNKTDKLPVVYTNKKAVVIYDGTKNREEYEKPITNNFSHRDFSIEKAIISKVYLFLLILSLLLLINQTFLRLIKKMILQKILY